MDRQPPDRSFEVEASIVLLFRPGHIAISGKLTVLAKSLIHIYDAGALGEALIKFSLHTTLGLLSLFYAVIDAGGLEDGSVACAAQLRW